MSTIGELIFLKPKSDAGLASFAGSVRVNLPGADMGRGVRLLMMPVVPFTNKADKSRTKSHYAGNPEIYPIVCETVIDKSVIAAFNCVAEGRNIGDVSIYKMTSTGDRVSIQSQVDLYNTFISEVSLVFDVTYDQATGEGLKAIYKLVCDKVELVRTAYDQNMQAIGKLGSEADRVKQIGITAG